MSLLVLNLISKVSAIAAQESVTLEITSHFVNDDEETEVAFTATAENGKQGRYKMVVYTDIAGEEDEQEDCFHIEPAEEYECYTTYEDVEKEFSWLSK